MADRSEPAGELDVQPSSLLGQRVRRHRRELGWTQAQLAQRAALSVSTVSLIECGNQRPLHHTTKALAKALGLSSERLLGLGEQPTLFPLPDERRVELLRRLINLDDDGIEEAWVAVRRVLDRVERHARSRAVGRAPGRGPGQRAKEKSRD